MEKLLPEEHLMLASVKRVKALILEEIALDTMPNSAGMMRTCRTECIDYRDVGLVKPEP
jgi:hypothetical protein